MLENIGQFLVYNREKICFRNVAAKCCSEQNRTVCCELIYTVLVNDML